MATVEVTSRRVGEIPRLAEPFTPCPLCRGTINLDYPGDVLFCESCLREWDLLGNPVNSYRKWQAILDGI